MLEKIDNAILSACTKFSHLLQRTTGLTNYFVAKVGIILVTIHLIMEVINRFHQFLPYKTAFFKLFVIGLLFISMIDKSYSCTKAEENLWSTHNIKPASLMPYTNSKFFRLSCVVMFLIDIALAVYSPFNKSLFLEIAHGTFFSLGLAIFYYFIAVDPLPPGRSKVREWLKRFTTIRKLVPVSTDR